MGFVHTDSAHTTTDAIHRLSVAQHGMRNVALNWGLLFETVLMCVFIYVPGLNDAIGTQPLRFEHWLPALPFVVSPSCSCG